MLLLTPWFVGNYYINGTWSVGYYQFGGAALFLPLLIGWLQLIMAIFSNNDHGFIKVFPMQMHLFLDVVTGSFLMCSPFVYGFSEKVFWPQVLIGGLIFFAGVFTKGSPLTSMHHSLPEGQLTSTDSDESVLMH